MEKFGILDLINKIQNITGGQNENKPDGTPPSAASAAATKTNGADANVGQDPKSYMRTYNPFGSINAFKPQVTSPKAKKPSKSTIDLKNSKNLAGDNSPESGSNMIQLIARHNMLAQKIKSHK